MSMRRIVDISPDEKEPDPVLESEPVSEKQPDPVSESESEPVSEKQPDPVPESGPTVENEDTLAVNVNAGGSFRLPVFQKTRSQEIESMASESAPRVTQELELTTLGTFDSDIGMFKSNRDYKNVDSTVGAELTLGPSGREYWGGLLALTMLDMQVPKNEALRLNMEMQDLIRNQFTIKIYTWLGTILFNAGVSWIRFPTNSDMYNPFHFGVSQRRCGEPVFRDIVFPNANPSGVAPKVFVALSGFDINGKWSLAANPVNVGARGFRLNLEAGPDDAAVTSKETTLWLAKAIWIATTSPKVFVGEFEGSTHGWQGYVRFPPHSYQNAPSLFTGITEFDVDSSHNFRVHVTTVPFKTGFTWTIKTWGDTVLGKIKVRYMAIF